MPCLGEGHLRTSLGLGCPLFLPHLWETLRVSELVREPHGEVGIMPMPRLSEDSGGTAGAGYGPSTFLLEAVLQFSAFWGSAAGREGRLIKRKAAHHAEPSLMLGFGVTGSRNLDLGCSIR